MKHVLEKEELGVLIWMDYSCLFELHKMWVENREQREHGGEDNTTSSEWFSSSSSDDD